MRPSRYRPPSWCSAGFTLLELLAVLIIVGVIASFAVLSVGDRGASDRLDREARRLGELLHIAGQEAILQSRELGVEFTPAGYRFLVLDKEQWTALGGDDLLRERAFPAGFEIRLFLEGLPVVLEKKRKDKKDDNKAAPHLFLLSSGETSPFELTLIDPQAELRCRVKGDVMGGVTVEGPERGWR